MFERFSRSLTLTFLVAIAAALMLSPTQATATVCPTDTLENVLALGSCTIGTATFSFSAKFGGSAWYPGPFAGDTQLGPSAGSVTFIPEDVANNPGFKLTGDFSVSGSQSFADEALAYLNVDGPVNFTGFSTELFGANVATDSPYNIAYVSLGSATSYVSGSGVSQTSASQSIFPHSNLDGLEVDFRTYDYAGSSVAFSGASIHFQQQLPSGVPEPTSAGMVITGIVGLLGFRRRQWLIR